ncbi:MAG: MoaD/ThiS family protein [Phaeodactylibacter sp.]|uniref:MoaD/ThiS family protein n=1 Tax=Phaeodactylibacter sp. TaxID=1940289 RepID=UPI0032EBA343
MEIQVIAFGIAKDILGGHQITMELPPAATVSDLKSKLMGQFPDFAKLAALSVAINTSYATDDQEIRPSDEVVIIPPVSGG